MSSHLFIVVLCEEANDQLWPLSRRLAPYDLLIPTSGEGGSLLADVVRNVSDLTANPLIIMADPTLTETINVHLIGQDVLKQDDFVVMGEAQPQSQALSIALAAARIKLKDPQAVMLVISTHQRFNADEFWESAVSRAYKAAEEGYLAVVGTSPRTTASLHSCVIPTSELSDLPGVYRTRSFIAHPSSTFCSRMSSQGALWCTDILFMKATVALAELRKVADASNVDKAKETGRIAETANFLAALGGEQWLSKEARELIDSLPAVSFKDAVLEHSDKLLVVPTSFDWAGFSSFEELVGNEQDRYGNSLAGYGTLVDTDKTTVFSKSKRLVTALGTRNLMIVDTPDALLVADKDHLAKMDELIEALQEMRAPQLDTTTVSARIWGTSEVLWSNSSCTVERLEIVAGGELPSETVGSMEEHWTVVEGTLALLYDNQEQVLEAGMSTLIHPHMERYLCNPTQEPAIAIVVSTIKETLF